MGTTRRAGLAGAVLLLGALSSGCAGDPEAYPPTGVDGLVIPTPAPDPGDFVAEVDNPWFPLEPGTRWSYADAGGPRTVAVALRGPVVDGVRTTALRTSTPRPNGHRSTTTDYYAQDRAGDVWWFGRAGEWRAGPGAGAGLAMAAHPRRGDGYAMTPAPDGVRAVVVATGMRWHSPLGSTHRAVMLEVVRDGVADVETFAPGIGLVSKGETGLVSYQPRP